MKMFFPFELCRMFRLVAWVDEITAQTIFKTKSYIPAPPPLFLRNVAPINS